ncbi:MAG TPA: hypothetical protein VK361_10230 [Rubrobacteraceae bacterium]|nr:hypothetical protein [Rubrobacteraceae bacterium]
MSVNKEQGPQARDYSRCQIAHSPGKSPSSSCAEAAKEKVDGLPLCERHALEAKLEGQIECWEEMLFHIDLWSREARRRQRPDVVGLLEDQRTQAIFASHRACEDLDVLRRSETSLGEVLSGGGEVFRRVRRGSLPLPPKAARPPFLGLRRPRRR